MAILHIHAQSEGGPRTRIQAGRHTFLIDEPPAFGGEDAAPSPVEMLLASLAGAISAIGWYVAQELSLPLRKLDIHVDGTCDGACFFGTSFEARAGFQSIRVSVRVDANAPDELIAQWKEQVLLRCPVLDNLLTPAEVAVSFSAEAATERPINPV